MDYISLIGQFGEYSKKPGGAFEVRLGKREANEIVMNCKWIINNVEKMTRKALLVDGNNGDIITVYNLK